MDFNIKDFVACKVSELQLSNINYHFTTVKEKISLIWEFLPNGLPKPSMIQTNIVSDPWLVYPYDKFLISKIRDVFLDAGWKETWKIREDEVESTGYNRNPRVCFESPSKKLSVICEFDDTRPGSTCTRKVIGKKLVENDVVEFVCNDENTD